MTHIIKDELKRTGVIYCLVICIGLLAFAQYRLENRINYLENEVENIKIARCFVKPDYEFLPFYHMAVKVEDFSPEILPPESVYVQYYSDDDAIMMAKLLYKESRGVPSKAERSAVAWTVLNRVDDTNAFPDTIAGVIQEKNQFAYDAKAPVKDEMLELSYDVLDRWNREKNGESDVGRTLAKEYEFFYGDGVHNHFYKLNSDGYRVEWDFPWGNPYGD